MVDLAMLQVVRDLVAIFGVIAGFSYYVMTVRNAQKTRELSLKAQELTLKAQEQALETRQAQLYMNLYATYHSPEFRELLYKIMFHQEWKDYDEWKEKYGEENYQELVAFGSVMGYFNGLGLLVRKGLIDVDTVYELLSSFVLWVWEKHLPIVQVKRDESNRPFWNEFEYLYNEIMKIDQQHPELKT